MKFCHDEYNIKTAHKEVLVDYDDAESNAFVASFGQELSNVLRGCAVHFIRSCFLGRQIIKFIFIYLYIYLYIYIYIYTHHRLQ